MAPALDARRCECSHRYHQGSAKYERWGWLLLAARGWRDFCFFYRESHDSPAAGGYLAASKTRAASGFRALSSSRGSARKTGGAATRKSTERERHDELERSDTRRALQLFFIP